MLKPIAALLAACALSACAAPFAPAPTPPPTAVPRPATEAPLATATPAPTPDPREAEPTSVPTAAAGGVELITGEFSYTNDFVFTYYVENAVALVDMRGFIARDQEYEIPVEGQTLGYMDLEPENMRGTFRLQLPARPTGVLSDVDNDGGTDTGVQVFAVSWWPNLAGGPFAVGDDKSRGWPNYLASVQADTEREDEIVGGKLVIWAPDGQQQFPTGFGDDGLLFTADDPVGPVPAGYSVVDLDAQPFAVSRQPEEQLTLYEPQDVAIKDFSNLSYTEAFERTVEQLRKEYAFNGIPGKEPDWDALLAELRPRIAEAERTKDERAFYLALQDFILAFPDGHVGLDGGEIGALVFAEQTAGGYGFAIRELTEGGFGVVYVLEGGPAAEAGMQVGATVTAFNGMPIDEAVAAVRPPITFSTEHTRRYQQARYLLRAPVGATAEVTFANPGGAPTTVTLTAIEERQSFAVTSVLRGFDPLALPVEFRRLESGVGYIKINSNYDDLNLLVRLFERALRTFQSAQAPGVIIDLRQNSGGSPLGLAGFLTDQVIPTGQRMAYSDETGKFEPRGVPGKIEPNEGQYRFNKVAVLVGLACSSACEFEAYGFSKVPGAVVVGHFPTNGIFADVARGQYVFPAGFSAQFSASRTVLPDGSLLIEGTGVQPTVRVPITVESLLSPEDEELLAAEREILGN
ncbi:MAG TPA: S41 family peptidase [Roseiflexaceae bacterium]|nr:S41 family peptidase [Roseiflexaceae bacterium]